MPVSAVSKSPFLSKDNRKSHHTLTTHKNADNNKMGLSAAAKPLQVGGAKRTKNIGVSRGSEGGGAN